MYTVLRLVRSTLLAFNPAIVRVSGSASLRSSTCKGVATWYHIRTAGNESSRPINVGRGDTYTAAASNEDGS